MWRLKRNTSSLLGSKWSLNTFVLLRTNVDKCIFTRASYVTSYGHKEMEKKSTNIVNSTKRSSTAAPVNALYSTRCIFKDLLKAKAKLIVSTAN